MRNPPFNPLAYVRKLEAAGVDRQQAEIHAEAFQLFEITQEAVIREDLVTKTDLAHAIDRALAQMRLESEKTRTELREEIAGVKNELQQQIGNIETQLAENKSGQIKWLVGLFVAQTTLIIGLIPFLLQWLAAKPMP